MNIEKIIFKDYTRKWRNTPLGIRSSKNEAVFIFPGKIRYYKNTDNNSFSEHDTPKSKTDFLKIIKK